MLNLYFNNDCTTRKTCFCSFILILTFILTPAALLAETSNVPKTGQSISYTNKDDGDLEKGINWPSPRFSDNGDGTVTDTLTNLTWLKKADCFTGDWAGALNKALTLKNGGCNLSDGSTINDWRLPNVRELESLLHLGEHSPALPNIDGSGGASYQSPFLSLQEGNYWTSTTHTAAPSGALIVDIRFGHITSGGKVGPYSSLFVRNSSNGSSPIAQVFTTGQTLCYDSLGVPLASCAGTRQDGDVLYGMKVPPPRFTDNFNGTVYDNLTGLIWLKNANCFGISGWTGAISITNLLSDGTCGLNDDSIAEDWRIPNRKELMSLIDYGFKSPALTSGHPFINVQATSGYWSSTTFAGFTGNAWYANFSSGLIDTTGKQNIAYIWPVRNNLTSTLTVSIEGDGTGEVTSSPAGIACPGQCSSEFLRLSSVLLTARPVAGSRFDGWSAGDCGTNKTCLITMSAAQSVTATFVEGSAVSSWLMLLLGD